MALLFDGCINFIEVVVFSKATIGITPSTCRHCTLSNSNMCSDSYPIPTSLSISVMCSDVIPILLFNLLQPLPCMAMVVAG